MKTLVTTLCLLMTFATANANELFTNLEKTLKVAVSNPAHDKSIETDYTVIPNSENQCLLALIRNSVTLGLDDDLDYYVENVRTDMVKLDFSKLTEKSFVFQEVTDGSDRLAKAMVGVLSADRKPLQSEVYDTTNVYTNGNFFDFQNWHFLGVAQLPFLPVGFRNNTQALKFREAALAIVQNCK